MPGRRNKITNKQQVFIDEYLVDFSATAAALRAGYSPKSAKSIGHELLYKPHIAEALGKAMEARAERTKIDADWVLKHLADRIGADIGDLYDKNGDLKPVSQWPKPFRLGLVAGLEIESRYVKKKRVVTIKKMRLADRMGDIRLIGQHVAVNAFVDRKELSGPDGGPIPIDDKNANIIDAAQRILYVLEHGLKDQEPKK